MTDRAEQERCLVLHIKVPGIYADDLDESARLWSSIATGVAEPEDYLNVVLEEWMRDTVGLTIVTLPSEKSLNEDFEVHSYEVTIVGAETVERKTARRR